MKAASAKDFLASIVPIVGGRSVAFTNMYNIYGSFFLLLRSPARTDLPSLPLADYFNVQYTHNATFLNSTDANTLSQVRALTDYHE